MPTETARRRKLLGIDPGTRELGYACFDGEQLVDYGVKVPPRGQPPKELLEHVDRLLLRLVEEKRPDVLALEQNSFSQIQQNALVTLLVVRMKALARKHGLAVAEYAPRTIRHAVCADGDATKAELARVLAARFPELRYYRSSDRRWRERYYQHIFDAAACGLTHLSLGRA
jgi:Holliday junction resolvasome RuvABC endonuclease subunit